MNAASGASAARGMVHPGKRVAFKGTCTSSASSVGCVEARPLRSYSTRIGNARDRPTASSSRRAQPAFPLARQSLSNQPQHQPQHQHQHHNQHGLGQCRCISSTPPARSGGRALTTALVFGIVTVGAYVIGSLYPPSLLTLVRPREVPALPSEETEEGKAHTAQIEAELWSLPAVKELMAKGRHSGQTKNFETREGAVVGAVPGSNPSTQQPSISTEPSTAEGNSEEAPLWIFSRPYRKFPPSKLLHSLTAKTLRGPGKFAVPPLVISKTAQGASTLGGSLGDGYTFLHLGRSMCGHDGIIHGGLLATVCDEALARTAFFSLPSRVGVTAHLEIDYRAPTRADQFVVLQTELVEAKGRKVEVKGEIRDGKGKVLVQTRAVFVEPRIAKFLDTSLVKEAMDTE